MDWDLNNDGGGKKFEKGQRYELVIARGEEGESSNKGTPFLKMHFETLTREKAYDKTLYNTPKAAYRMIEWAEAMGFASVGNANIDADSLAGIHITCECDYRKGDDGRDYLEWINPQSVSVDGKRPAQKPAPMPKPMPSGAEDMPF